MCMGHVGVAEQSSRLVDRQVGRKSGKWGVRVKQEMAEWSRERHRAVEWKSNIKWGICRVGVGYGCEAKRIGEGDILRLRWKGFTGDMLTVERSGHWSR